ncbi:MAG TPA: glycosyltransferase family 4 protein [Burkholderiales bacterium]|nr:glycosyltransferase family 4 protein [Burkholderiales bacterium]
MAARVTLVTHYYPAHRGGVERVAGQLAERLAASDSAEFEWHASDCDAAPAAVRGIKTVPARSWNGIERLLGFPYPLWSTGALRRLAQACRSAEVVHLHDCLYFANVVAYLAARRAGRPVIVTQHIGHVPYRNPLLRVLLAMANGILGRWILGGADRVVFESATVQDYFTRFVRFRAPPLLIANGVDTDHFAPAAAAGRRAERPVLLFLGRFVEKKGLSVLHELARRLPDTQWLLAGWGPLDPSSWRLPNVRVVPSPGAAQLASLYREADLFVLPSVGEGVPLSLQEAMACGTPALVGEETAAGIPGAEQVLLRERVGDAAAVERWSARIRALLGSGELQALRPRVAAFAREHWSWQRCVGRYAELIAASAAPSARR